VNGLSLWRGVNSGKQFQGYDACVSRASQRYRLNLPAQAAGGLKDKREPWGSEKLTQNEAQYAIGTTWVVTAR
jgi:hypothetical protein